jgi:hypothetical protein
MTKNRHLIGGLLATLLTVSVARAEQIDNPAYKGWAKCKPGSTVTLKSDIAAQGMTMSTETINTLKELTADKAVVDSATTMDMGGMKQTGNHSQDVPAKVEKGQQTFAPDMKGDYKDVGNESVEVAGKKYDCKVMEFTGTGRGGVTMTGKIWSTEQIPGGVAKMEMNAMGGVVKMVVTAFEAK